MSGVGDGTDCCFDCHFKWEERELFGVLPWPLYRWMRVEHAVLRARRYPLRAVEAHARIEEHAFRPYLSAAQYSKLVDDHRKLE